MKVSNIYIKQRDGCTSGVVISGIRSEIILKEWKKQTHASAKGRVENTNNESQETVFEVKSDMRLLCVKYAHFRLATSVFHITITISTQPLQWYTNWPILH